MQAGGGGFGQTRWRWLSKRLGIASCVGGLALTGWAAASADSPLRALAATSDPGCTASAPAPGPVVVCLKEDQEGTTASDFTTHSCDNIDNRNSSLDYFVFVLPDAGDPGRVFTAPAPTVWFDTGPASGVSGTISKDAKFFFASAAPGTLLLEALANANNGSGTPKGDEATVFNLTHTCPAAPTSSTTSSSTTKSSTTTHTSTSTSKTTTTSTVTSATTTTSTGTSQTTTTSTSTVPTTTTSTASTTSTVTVPTTTTSTSTASTTTTGTVSATTTVTKTSTTTVPVTVTSTTTSTPTGGVSGISTSSSPSTSSSSTTGGVAAVTTPNTGGGNRSVELITGIALIMGGALLVGLSPRRRERAPIVIER